MVDRVFGPVRGAGVQVEEQQGLQPIQPGALGQVGFVGLFEKGDVGKLIQVPTKTAFAKKLGGYIPESQAPDAAIDFFDVGKGAGGMWVIRVTDGNELQAQLVLNARRTLKTPVITVKAKNGGRWGGKYARFTGSITALSDLTATAMTTGVNTWKTNQWAGGFLELDGVVGKKYLIVSNTASGVITVAADAQLHNDLQAGTSSDHKYFLSLDNNGKALSVQVRDGDAAPTTEFALDVFVDGKKVNSYPNLSMDPLSTHYFVRVINDDDGNDEIVVVDSYVGDHTVADVRPANAYGTIASVTPLVLTANMFDTTTNSAGGGNATFVLGALTDAMLPQTITLTFSSATAYTAVSDRFGALGSGTLGTPLVSANKWCPGITGTAGVSPMASGDTVVINFKPFIPGNLVGGFVYPDKVNAPMTKFRIVANDHNTITAAPGSDMTGVGATADQFSVSFDDELVGGRDGHADITDTHYVQQGFDTDSSPFKQFAGKNLGLVKLAVPGVTSVVVQKAGIAFAEGKNLQFREEIPSNVVTEQSAEDFVDNQVGRSDYAVTSFPSYGYVADPTGVQGNKLTTLTGQILGMEASYAKSFAGYHKAEAGVDAVLPKVLALPTGDKVLDEEFLNPLGINVVKKKKGNFVAWGDRTLCRNSEWKFKHQREQMSYYEQVFLENLDDIVFAINDEVEQKKAIAVFRAFFLPEFQKRAIRGKTLDDAVTIKIDAENNTDATAADGDMIADLAVRLADTVERLRIRISKQGVFEAAK